jgi:hypothetical protein
MAIHIGIEHMRAGPRQRMGNGLANAARRPRDNGNTPVETQIRGFHENSPRFCGQE